VTRSRIWPGPGVGTSTSTTRGGWPTSRYWTACMVFLLCERSALGLQSHWGDYPQAGGRNGRKVSGKVGGRRRSSRRSACPGQAYAPPEPVALACLCCGAVSRLCGLFCDLAPHLVHVQFAGVRDQGFQGLLGNGPCLGEHDDAF